MTKFRSKIIFGLALLGMTGPLAVGAGAARAANYDDAGYCSKYLSTHDDKSLSPGAHRRCILAIATTYISGEENSIPVNQELLAPDVSRHPLGTDPDFKPGARDKIFNNASPGTSVIGAIKNRRWTVDGNNAWIQYDGYLKTDPAKPQFFVAERITVEKGLIKEVMIGGVAHAKEAGAAK